MTNEPSPWELSSDDLEAFVSGHLRQKDAFLQELQRALRGLVTYIKENASYSVSRVVVSGDLVRGTTALDEEAEFQISLYLSDFRSIGDYRRGSEAILRQTRELLDAEAALHAVMPRGRDGATPGGLLAIRLLAGDEWIDGQVAPAVDLIGPNPSKPHKETMYRQFMQDEDKSPYQATMSDLRLNLFQALPTPVKDVILLVKFWRRSRLRLRGDKPAPPFFELLVVHCWEAAGSPETFDLAVAMKGVLTALSEWRNVRIVWKDSHCLGYPPRIAEAKQRAPSPARSADYDGPIALDPIDPRLEYCAGVKTLIWDEISRSARESLMEPLFRGIKACTKWKASTPRKL